jgi:hypothetical protein
VGVLFKYIPLIILPFLALEKKKIQWRVVAAFTAVVTLGMGLGYLKWGSAELYPLIFTRDRPSNFISIFRFLRGPYSPIPSQDGLSSWLMVGSWGLLVLAHWIYDLEIFFISIVAFTTVLLFSKIGHPQYYTPLFFLVPYWWLREKEGGRNPRVLVLQCFVTQLLFLAFVKVIYAMTQGFKNGWEWLDDLVGLPAFIIGIGCLIPVLRELISCCKNNDTDYQY